MRIYWTGTETEGDLGMMARPRGNEWLEDEIRKLKTLRVDTLVSLLEKAEISELELLDEALFCDDYGIDYVHFPIPDREVPEDDIAFLSLAQKLHQKILAGEKVVIHCRIGIGRTGMLAAAVLMNGSFVPAEVFDFLSHKRQLSVPDTSAQKQWMMRLSSQIKPSLN